MSDTGPGAGGSAVPIPAQLNLVVSDLDASLAFYRLLGWDFGPPTGLHATLTFDNGFSVDLDQHAFASEWNSGTPDVSGGSVVVCLSIGSRAAVDELWSRLVASGHASRQVPYDTFWGSRFAVVADPDGYQIGLMSPSEAEHRYWPPSPAPGD